MHDQIKDGDWWLGGLDVRHLYQLAELTRSPEGIDWRALTSAMPDQLARDALESQLIALREMFGIAIPRKSALSGRFLPRWQHARRIFQARHPVISAPLRAAGCLTWLFRRAHVERTHRAVLPCYSRALQEARSGAGANAARRGRAGAGPEGLILHPLENNYKS